VLQDGPIRAFCLYWHHLVDNEGIEERETLPLLAFYPYDRETPPQTEKGDGRV
jgi:hypothetical protein